MIPMYIVVPVTAGVVPQLPQFPLGTITVLRSAPVNNYKGARIFTQRSEAQLFAEYEAQRNPNQMFYIFTSEGVVQAAAAPIQAKKFNENGELIPA